MAPTPRSSSSTVRRWTPMPGCARACWRSRRRALARGFSTGSSPPCSRRSARPGKTPRVRHSCATLSRRRRGRGSSRASSLGTVVNWRDSVAREAKTFLGPKGYDKDWHAFADKWRERYQPAMEKVRNGERPWGKPDDLHRENLVQLLPEFEISGLGEAEIDHLNRAWHRLDGWPDTVE